MAKVSFVKLGLNKNQDIKTLEWNGQIIEVKQYLPLIDKLNLISTVVNKSHDEKYNFANPVRIDVFTSLEVLYNYTNINFTDKQKEDFSKLYDIVKSSGLLKAVIELIPEAEYSDLISSINLSVTSIYNYQNSVLGVLDTISTDYNSLDLDATKIAQDLSNPESFGFLKDVLSKMG